ncbi:hypothetical protein SJAV_27440 [Sulfurisphaera javensis]|uniref:Transposase n=1 Tax=Sulfurisphaera javensis TaxID=2049879 RepID=A0AAT9GVE7_9CREN
MNIIYISGVLDNERIHKKEDILPGILKMAFSRQQRYRNKCRFEPNRSIKTKTSNIYV